MYRCHCLIRRRRPACLTLHHLAVLLGAPSPEPESSAPLLDGPAAHEAVDVEACARPLRGHADDCLRQLGGIRELVGVGAAVLPAVPGPEPDPNDAAHATASRRGDSGSRFHRVHDRARRRRVHRRHGNAHDRLRGPPVRRDRTERAVLGVLLPFGVSRRARRGPHVRGWHAVHRQGVTSARAERCGGAIPVDDADWCGDRRQRVHAGIQWGPQSAV